MNAHASMPFSVLAAILAGCASQAADTVDPAVDSASIQTYIAKDAQSEGPFAFDMVEVDLNGDGKEEVLVQMTDDSFCGRAGCTMFVLEKDEAGGFVRKMRATITNSPVRVLEASSQGWRDLGVTVRGSAMTPPYEARMRFDGKAYPSNPSMEPEVPATEGGTVVIWTEVRP